MKVRKHLTSIKYNLVLIALSIFSPLIPIKFLIGSCFIVFLVLIYFLKNPEIKIFSPTLQSSFYNTFLIFLVFLFFCNFGLSKHAVSIALFLTAFYGFIYGLFKTIAFYSILGYFYNVYFLYLSKNEFLLFNPPMFFISLICALSATLVESVETDADKRLTMFLALLTVYTIFIIYSPQVNATQLLIAFTISFLLSLFALKTGTADKTGLISATLVGLIIIVFTNLKFFATLFLFYALGSIFTKYKYDLKLNAGIAEPGGGARGCANVFSNSLAAVFFAMNYGIYGNLEFLLAFIAAVAAALGDTLASEIGKTSKNVYLITNLKRVKPGESGGVSIIGEVSALFGCLIIVVASFLLNLINSPSHMFLVLIASFAAVHIDSILGATLERWGIFTNFCVNLTATSCSGLLAIIFTWLF